MQRQEFSLSSANNIALNSSNASLAWSVHKYRNHQIAFSDLGSITATINIYPICAGADQYTTVTATEDNQVKVFNHETYGPIGAFFISFSSGFTGTVYFGSSVPNAGD